MAGLMVFKSVSRCAARRISGIMTVLRTAISFAHGHQLAGQSRRQLPIAPSISSGKPQMKSVTSSSSSRRPGSEPAFLHSELALLR